jgi:hypothetical protein
MKKSLLLLLVLIVSLIPTAPVLAQGDDPIPPACQPESVLSDFELMFSDVQNFEDLMGALSFSSLVVMDCYDDWLNLLLELAMEQFGSGIPLPIPQAVPDIEEESSGPVASLTARDAEAALQAAFSGDIELANEYVCPAEQIDPTEGVGFPSDLVVNELSCQRLGDVMNCTYSSTSDALGGDLEDELNFEIVDELLCETIE